MRVYVSTRDRQGKARPRYLDLELADGCRILDESATVLDVGPEGAFDSDGLVATSVLKSGNEFVMHYVGFRRFAGGAYQMAIGLALSTDQGKTFGKISDRPVLSPEDFGFVNSAGAFWDPKHSDRPELLFSAGSDWLLQDGSPRPRYSLYAINTSQVGVPTGNPRLLIPANDRFMGIGRPWRSQGMAHDRLIVSLRSAHRLHYSSFELDDFSLATAKPMMLPTHLSKTENKWTRTSPVFVARTELDSGSVFVYNGRDLGRDGLYVSLMEEA